MSENSPWTIKMEQQEFTDHLLKSTIKGYNLALDDVLKVISPHVNCGLDSCVVCWFTGHLKSKIKEFEDDE